MAKRKRSTRSLPKYARKAIKQYDKLRIAKAAFRLANPRGGPDSQAFYGADFASANPTQRAIRSLTNFKGKGDYLSDFVKGGFFGKNALIAGAARGLGSHFGGTAGRNLAAGASKWLGFGDYGPVSTNTLIAGGSGDQQNASVNSGSSTGDIVFSHTEFVQNVVVTSEAAIGNTAFQVQAFNLNPGITSAFPFLAQIAQNYTMWEVAGLIFQYKPNSGEFGSAGSNSLGKVVMATNYDPEAPLFTSSQEMENYVGSNSTKPSCGMLHGVETMGGERLTNLLYVRTGASTVGPAPAGQKARTLTDLGIFQIATEGIFNSVATATQQVIGELWVTYRIKLTRPKLSLSILGNSIPQDQFEFGTDGAGIVINAIPKQSNTLGGTIISTIGSFITFQWPENVVAGTYRITLHVNMSGALSILTPFLAGSTLTTWGFPGASVFSRGLANDVDFKSSVAQAGATNQTIVIDVLVNAPGTNQATITFTTSGAAIFTINTVSGTATGGWFTVTQVDTRATAALA